MKHEKKNKKRNKSERSFTEALKVCKGILTQLVTTSIKIAKQEAKQGKKSVLKRPKRRKKGSQKRQSKRNRGSQQKRNDSQLKNQRRRSRRSDHSRNGPVSISRNCGSARPRGLNAPAWPQTTSAKGVHGRTISSVKSWAPGKTAILATSQCVVCVVKQDLEKHESEHTVSSCTNTTQQ